MGGEGAVGKLRVIHQVKGTKTATCTPAIEREIEREREDSGL